MAGRCGKNSYDPLAISTQPRWYVVRDQHNTLIEYQRLAPGTNLWAVLWEVMETHEQRGWLIEDVGEPKIGSFFCRKGDSRLFVSIQATDPTQPIAHLHGP